MEYVLHLSYMIKIVSSLIVLFGFHIISWGINYHRIAGKYSSNPYIGVYHLMELKKDSTFTYFWRTGMISGETKGQYQLNGRSIKFNSYHQPTDTIIRYKLLDYRNGDEDSIRIKFVDSNHAPVTGGHILLYSDSLCFFSLPFHEPGTCIIERKADTITFCSIQFHSFSHPIDSNITEYVFQINPRLGHYRYFTNEHWRYFNRKIISYEYTNAKRFKQVYQRK